MLETPRSSPSAPNPTPHSDPTKAPRRIRGSLGELDFEIPLDSPPSSFHGGPLGPPQGRLLMAWSWVASMIDILFVFALVCLFLLLSMWIERAGFQSFSSDRSLLLKAGVLIFCFLHSVYLLFLRIFLGSSFGEWACGLRLGIPRQRFSSQYSLLVVLRFILVVGTGVIVLPILSLISGVDWAGRLSGLPLISVQASPTR